MISLILLAPEPYPINIKLYGRCVWQSFIRPCCRDECIFTFYSNRKRGKTYHVGQAQLCHHKANDLLCSSRAASHSQQRNLRKSKRLLKLRPTKKKLLRLHICWRHILHLGMKEKILVGTTDKILFRNKRNEKAKNTDVAIKSEMKNGSTKTEPKGPRLLHCAYPESLAKEPSES